jgi:hypothetical protein
MKKSAIVVLSAIGMILAVAVAFVLFVNAMA